MLENEPIDQLQSYLAGIKAVLQLKETMQIYISQNARTRPLTNAVKPIGVEFS